MTDTQPAEFEYTVTCGKHEACTGEPRPQFGVFHTAAEAQRRAEFLGGDVLVRQIGGWQMWIPEADRA